MAKKRILIVDDEGYDNKCKAVREQIELLGMCYEIALTLKEATQCIERKAYDAIISDGNFPEAEGMEAKKKSGKLFLDKLEKQKIEVPVLFYAMTWRVPTSRLITNHALPWELDKLQDFLKSI